MNYLNPTAAWDNIPQFETDTPVLGGPGAPMNWQGQALANRFAYLGATSGASKVGYDGGTVQDVLDGAKPMANYTALRNYTGRATGVRITQSGLFGYFMRDDADTISADNGGTIIVDASGRRWKRLMAGSVSVSWFGAKGDGATDDTAAIQAAMNYAASVGAVLVAPSKATYIVSAGLSIPSGLAADFSFSTIKRKTGGVFNMLANTGGGGIRIWNLTVDGNRQADGRVATNLADRFGGIVLNSVSVSELRNVTVNNTVNAEDGRAGVYLGGCTRVDLYNVGGSGNDRSCVYIENGGFNRIFGSYTANNLGSGVTSQNADDCEYYDCVAVGSGYSGISINGKRNKGDRLRATGTAAGYAGVNIGHDDALNRADDSIIENVHSHDNLGWGVTVTGSARVQLHGVYLKGNANHNLIVNSNASACVVSGITSTASGASGVLLQSGKGHKIISGEIFGNAYYGIDVEAGCSAAIGADVRVYNNCTADNTLAGVVLNNAVDCTVDAECFDDQGTKTQGYGVWLVGGSGNLIGGYLHDLKTAPIRESSSPVYTTRNMRTGNNAMAGSFTPGASATSVTINNNNARAGMLVVFYPANAAGRSLGTPTLGTVTAGTSFVADLGGTAGGTEAYGYVIL